MGRCPLIEAQGLTKRYAGRAAVVDLTFSAENGQVLGLMGPEGAGKSTALRLLAGGLVPTSGSVSLAGHDTDSREGRRRTGYVAQGAPLDDDLRVDRYLASMARLRGVAARPAVDRALEVCGLTDHRRATIGRLPAAARRRVALAQAVVHAPAVLLLDDPAAGLGPEDAERIQTLIGDLARSRTTVMASRELSGLSPCERVLVLRAGRLVATETPSALHRAAERRLRQVTAVVAGDPAEIERQARDLAGVMDVELTDLGGGDHRLIVVADRDDLQDAVARVVIGGGFKLKELHLAREREA
jgi:ABC-2 type transport system ATP-binding protein